MKKALIIHGWEGHPDEPLLNYFKKHLASLGYEVEVPAMPNTDTPVIEDWLKKLGEIFDPSVEIMVGHSIGCQAALRFLETLPEKAGIKKLILIAPWMELDKQTIEEEGEEVVEVARPWMETPINFAKVKGQVGKTICIFSDDDSYVPLSQAGLFKDRLGAEIFIEKGQGHFTVDDSFKKLQTDLSKIL